jgi:tRNA(adenine34) deaminase
VLIAAIMVLASPVSRKHAFAGNPPAPTLPRIVSSVMMRDTIRCRAPCPDIFAGPAGSGTRDGMSRDESWMRRALALAESARAEGEVPVGAVVVRDGAVLGEGWNRPIATRDPTAHAEILALRAAAAAAGDYRLGGAALYVTLEPCPMCAAAMAHARIERLVFGAWDPRQGAAGSVFDLVSATALNHRVDAFGGVLSEECGALLRSFFADRR